jgi:alanine dehydrogenase
MPARGAGYLDSEYKAGARIARMKKSFSKVELIVKVKEPSRSNTNKNITQSFAIFISRLTINRPGLKERVQR